jgi:Ca2+-binding RTX toxin-like protein
MAGDDSLEAGSGNDVLEGEDGNDWLEGFHGDDSLFGGNGDDVLFGFRYFDLPLAGRGEVDTLIGGAGADRFVLGYQDVGGTYVPYSSATDVTEDSQDYALITDFKPDEGDLIQIVGPDKGLLSAATHLTASPAGFPEGTAIYARDPGELILGAPEGLIAIIEGVSYGDVPLSPPSIFSSNPPPEAPYGFTYDLAASINPQWTLIS